jgi:hypothetical protein
MLGLSSLGGSETLFLTLKNIFEARFCGTFFNPSVWEAEPGGLRVRVQPGLYSETLSQKQIILLKHMLSVWIA